MSGIPNSIFMGIKKITRMHQNVTAVPIVDNRDNYLSRKDKHIKKIKIHYQMQIGRKSFYTNYNQIKVKRLN